MSIYLPIPPAEKQKGGRKAGKKYPSRAEITAKRMQKFNGMPVVDAPKTAKDFNTKVQEIVNNQIGKMHQKSATQNLDLNEIKSVEAIVKIHLLITGKNDQEDTEANKETVALAMSVLTGETNGSIAKNVTPADTE